ncbi:MAG: DUF6206 family protein [Bacteroidota bacterium]
MELAEYVQWARKQQPFSRLGFFSQPVLATHGPLAGQMLKIYPPIRQEAKARRLALLHEGYARELAATGRRIPLTRMELVPMGNRWVPMIIQEAFAEEDLVRQTLERLDSFSEYQRIVNLILKDTLLYLDNRAYNPQLELGFHPTLRNYALRLNKLYYFDTFPPMNLPQAELNKIIRQSLPQAWLRYLSWIFPRILNRVSHEYYDPTAMITGIVGSACRLRPEWSDQTLSGCQEYLSQEISTTIALAPILEKLQSKPKLSTAWTTIRKLTKNIGKPNN